MFFEARRWVPSFKRRFETKKYTKLVGLQRTNFSVMGKNPSYNLNARNHCCTIIHILHRLAARVSVYVNRSDDFHGP